MLAPPMLSGAFRTIAANDAVHRFGYAFRVMLPGNEGRSVSESTHAPLADGVTDPDAAEQRWCAYAWPVSPSSGRRTFFVDDRGAILVTSDARYAGERAPDFDAALAAPDPESSLPPRTIRGRDGNAWRQVN